MKIARRLLGIGIIVLVFLLLFLFSSIDRDTLGSGVIRDSLSSRVMIWNASIRMIVEHPFSGVGPRNFQEAYLAFQFEFPPYLEWAVPHPHNILLSFWLFTGIIGFIGFALLLGVLFRRVVQDVFPVAPGVAPVFSGLLLGLLVSFCVHGMVDTPYFRNDLAYVFWAIAVFIFISEKKDAEAPKIIV